MEDLLFLAHRIPYPPQKGDKIRSYHLLRHLSERYRVHLGAFIDDEADYPHVTVMEQLCAGETCFVRLRPFMARVRALRGLLTGGSLTFPYYAHPRMQRWVNEILAVHPIRRVVVYSAAPAQFVLQDLDPGILRVIDFVDVDSLKWRQYAQGRRGLARWLYQREGRTLLAEEKMVAARFDRSLFVSEPEAKSFQALAAESADKITYWENGVDVDYFSPERSYANPYADHELPLVFTGAMDYWANVDAVVWFAGEIFPTILAEVPTARLVIVGGRPTQEVMQLQNQPHITVTGRVEDVRPWLAWAKAAVAPMRIAQGVQNKVLEAMAMARPVLATPKAMEGIRWQHHWVAETPERLAAMGSALLRGADEEESGPKCGLLGRQVALSRYNWRTNLKRAASLIAGEPL